MSRFLTPRVRPALAALTAPASAQSSPCMDIQKHIEERKAIVARLQALGGKKKSLDPKEACALFGKLVVNGNSTLKWAETNKDWCQVPDSFVEGVKNDHNRATSLKGQAPSSFRLTPRVILLTLSPMLPKNSDVSTALATIRRTDRNRVNGERFEYA